MSLQIVGRFGSGSLEKGGSVVEVLNHVGFIDRSRLGDTRPFDDEGHF